MRKITLFLIVFTFFSMGIYSFSTASSDPGFFLKGSSPYGVPYEEWLVRWWQWNYNIPRDQHPMSTNIKECAVREYDPVIFLTHKLENISTYSCSLPAGKAILAPIGFGACTTIEADSSDPKKMIECSEKGDQHLNFKVGVDGVILKDLEKNYVTHDKKFNVTISENPWFAHPPGQWEAVLTGYYLFLEPLAAGNHNIFIQARVVNQTE